MKVTTSPMRMLAVDLAQVAAVSSISSSGERAPSQCGVQHLRIMMGSRRMRDRQLEKRDGKQQKKEEGMRQQTEKGEQLGQG